MLSHLVVLGSPQPASEQVSASCAVVLYALRLRSCVNGSSVTSVRMGLDFKRKSSVPAPLSPQHQSLLASQTNVTFEVCICRFAQLTLRRIRDITSHCIEAHRTRVGVIKNDVRNDLFALSEMIHTSADGSCRSMRCSRAGLGARRFFAMADAAPAAFFIRQPNGVIESVAGSRLGRNLTAG